MNLEILEMPNWKHDILRAVAWVLGYRGEHVYCVTMDIDLTKANPSFNSEEK